MKMEKSLKRKNRIIVLLLSILLFSCTDNNDSIDYSSIKGGWRCIESSEQGERTYLIDVYKKQSETTTYLVSNFHKVGYDSFDDILITVVGNKITIANQPLGSGQQLKAGSGTVSADFKQMSIQYRVTNGSTEIGYTANFTR